MSLGENIYKNRISMGKSQTVLAEELEVSRQSVSKWENNTAIPDLDKLIKMSKTFNITLDELVFGEASEKKAAGQPEIPISPFSIFSKSVIVGCVLLIFGMIFFLLSIFWGDHLYFGEAFGEVFSAVVVLLSISMIATNNFKILSICTVIYFMYSVVCYGILNVSSVSNYLFTFAAGAIILVWFIIYGTNANKAVDTDNGKDK